jgi:transformation/transcription domain-associated protein
MQLVFNYKPQLKVHDLAELKLERLLGETYSSFQLITEKAITKETQIFTVIPRGCMSLKVLAELPLNTIVMYNHGKSYLTQEITEIVTLMTNIIALRPSDEQRTSVDNKEVYADFVNVQVKALSLLVYFKAHKDYPLNNSDLMVNVILDLLRHCPPEVVTIRKDLLAISRHIFNDLRPKFLPYISQFFDETLFCGTGYTASESLRTSTCSMIADYVHSVRKQLSYAELCKAITYFSKCLHDPLLHTNLQNMCCRVLLGLIDCVRAKEQENNGARDMILKLLEVIVLKFKSLAKYHVSSLLEAADSTAAHSTIDQQQHSQSTSSTTNEASSSSSSSSSQLEQLETFISSSTSQEDKERSKVRSSRV